MTDTKKSANLVYIGIIVVLVLIVGYMLLQSTQTSTELASQQTVSNTVREMYELRFEGPAEVLRVDETNGLYRVVVRYTDFAGQQQTQDVYLTKDGKLLTTTLIITDNYKLLLSAEKAFIECVRDHGVRIFGKTTDTPTLQQMQALGDYAYKLFVPCDGENEATCSNIGITRYPTTVYNNTAYTDLYAPQFYAQLTGCGVQQ